MTPAVLLGVCLRNGVAGTVNPGGQLCIASVKSTHDQIPMKRLSSTVCALCHSGAATATTTPCTRCLCLRARHRSARVCTLQSAKTAQQTWVVCLWCKSTMIHWGRTLRCVEGVESVWLYVGCLFCLAVSCTCDTQHEHAEFCCPTCASSRHTIHSSHNTRKTSTPTHKHRSVTTSLWMAACVSWWL